MGVGMINPIRFGSGWKRANLSGYSLGIETTFSSQRLAEHLNPSSRNIS